MKKIFSNITGYFSGVVKEMKKSHWPSKKEVINYSVVTVVLLVFFGAFFYVLDVAFAFLRGLV
jgi:preprotein translocase subunit SecE